MNDQIETLTHKPTRITGKDGITRAFMRVATIETAPAYNFGFRGHSSTFHIPCGQTFRVLINELRHGYGLQGVTGITTDGSLYRYEY